MSGLERRWTIHRTIGIGFIDLEKPNAVVSGAAIAEPVDVVDATTYEGAVAERDELRRQVEEWHRKAGEWKARLDAAGEWKARLDAAGEKLDAAGWGQDA